MDGPPRGSCWLGRMGAVADQFLPLLLAVELFGVLNGFFRPPEPGLIAPRGDASRAVSAAEKGLFFFTSFVSDGTESNSRAARRAILSLN